MTNYKLYLNDCSNVLPQLDHVDAIITDPPFGTGVREWDVEPDTKIWAEMQRLCPDGPIAIFGYPKQLFRWATHFSEMELIGYVVWYIYNAPMVTQGLTKIHQDIAIWGRSSNQIRAGRVREPYSTNHLTKWFNVPLEDSSLRKTRLSNSARKERHPSGRRCTDVWAIAAPGAGFNSHLRKHPNEKPLEVMRRLCLLLSDEGNMILDCFMGSGTTGEAAIMTKRNFIGVELIKDYFDIASRRMDKAAQTTLGQFIELSESKLSTEGLPLFDRN